MGLKQVVTAESWMQVVIKGDVKVCVDNLNVIRLNLKKYFLVVSLIGLREAKFCSPSYKQACCQV